MYKFAMRSCFPSIDGLDGLDKLDMDAFLDRYFKEAPPLLRLGMFASTMIFMWLPVLTIWVPLPAFLLPKSWRDKHTDRLMTSRFYTVRMIAMTLKMQAGMAWAEHCAVRDTLGCRPIEADPGTWQTGENV